MTTLPRATRPRPGALLAGSWRMLVAHPLIGTALGAAVLFSLASALFGIGALCAPWFLCEIFALQLAIATGRSVPRHAGWVRAGALVLGIVSLVVAATWIAVLAIGPDVATADSAAQPLPWPEALRRVALIAAATALAGASSLPSCTPP